MASTARDSSDKLLVPFEIRQEKNEGIHITNLWGERGIALFIPDEMVSKSSPFLCNRGVTVSVSVSINGGPEFKVFQADRPLYPPVSQLMRGGCPLRKKAHDIYDEITIAFAAHRRSLQCTDELVGDLLS